MSSDTGNTFGFELLYNVSKNQITKKEDVIILIVHWYFIKNGFKCLGSGDSKIIDPSEIGTELLPNNWSTQPNYTFRYVKESKLYILIGIKSEADFLINLLRVEDHSVSNVQFPIDTVKEIEGPLEKIMPNYESILNTLKKDLVEPVYTGTGREASTQTQESQSNRPRRDNDDDPLRVGPPLRPPASGLIPRANPFEIGRDDLDPFGQGRSGMLFDPFSNNQHRNPIHPGLGVPGRLPLGAVPPGARFDPFGPPDRDPPVGRLRNPDNDHLPPPGYDDMFM